MVAIDGCPTVPGDAIFRSDLVSRYHLQLSPCHAPPLMHIACLVGIMPSFVYNFIRICHRVGRPVHVAILKVICNIVITCTSCTIMKIIKLF